MLQNGRAAADEWCIIPPLDERIRAGGDAGTPAALSDEGQAAPFVTIAEAVEHIIGPVR